MKTVVVTSFTPEGYKQYGRNFLKTWDMHWPKDVELRVYTHNQTLKKVQTENIEEIQKVRDFLERHKENLICHGKVPDGLRWKQSEIDEGYAFRFDAYKFGRKPFVMAHAMRKFGRGAQVKLFWIDADIITFSRIPDNFLDSLLPDKMQMCFLPGQQDLTESSVVGFNLSHDYTQEFLAEFEYIYEYDKFYDYPCWDDGHIFDYLVAKRKPRYQYILSHRQPFEASKLGLHMVHLRGPAKDDTAFINKAMSIAEHNLRRQYYASYRPPKKSQTRRAQKGT